MARTVKLGEFQQLQRGAAETAADSFTIDPAAEDAEAAARLRAIGCGPHTSNGQAEPEPTVSDWQAVTLAPDPDTGEITWGTPAEPKAEDNPDAMSTVIAERLRKASPAANCTAEMSLHMITERVREAARLAGLEALATDAEIVAEAERIFGSFIDNRKGPREYTVDPSGEVRDWRRPDTTPDRGDVTEVHTVTDDEPRFSGGGDGQADERSKLVPTDGQFNGKLYREATELAALADELIEKHGYLEHLEHCTIRYWWKRKTGVQKGQRITGGLKRGSDLLGQLLGAEFAIWLAADTARERQFSDRRVERSLFRQLRRIGQDDNSNWIELPFSLQLFTEEIVEYADVGDDDLRIGHGAFRNADQMGLFTEDDEGDREEAAQAGYVETADGAGTLIWPDGTALTDDEIEAMERHELEDAPADPDGDSPEDEDILADPAVI